MDALQHLVDFIKRKKPDEDPVTYLYRLVEETLDPGERVEFYVESSEHFWREGLELVEKGELRQGSEKNLELRSPISQSGRREEGP